MRNYLGRSLADLLTRPTLWAAHRRAVATPDERRGCGDGISRDPLARAVDRQPLSVPAGESTLLRPLTLAASPVTSAARLWLFKGYYHEGCLQYQVVACQPQKEMRPEQPGAIGDRWMRVVQGASPGTPPGPNAADSLAGGCSVAIIGNRDTARFRGWLIRDMIAAGHRVVAIASNEPGLGQAITALGAEFRPISMQRTGINPFRDLADLIALAAQLREHRPDIVLTHGTKPNLLGVMAAKLAGVARIYVMMDGLGYAFAGGRELRRLCLRAVLSLMYASILRFSRAIFVLNPDDGRVIRSLGLERPSRPVVRIGGTGIDLEEFSYAPPATGPLNVLMIARLLREKGVMEYAAASQRLRDQGIACRMDLLGPYDSNPGAIDADQFSTWIAQHLIHYLGETDDVRPYLRACSILCLPSYREGLPRTILEALAIGRPIITTNVPGCRELVIDGVNGFIVPPRDPDALAAAIIRFVDRPDLLVTMAKASRALAEARYDVGDINPLIMATMGLSAPTSSPECGAVAQEPKWRR